MSENKEPGGCNPINGIIAIAFILVGAHMCGGLEGFSGNFSRALDVLASESQTASNIPIEIQRPEDKKYEGIYYPIGALDSILKGPHECLANIWMTGNNSENIGSTQASGLPSNMGNKLVIATWRAPLGQELKVTNLENQKSTHVIVTDRGPNELGYPDHCADLTPATANAIGATTSNNIRVRLELAQGYGGTFQQPQQNNGLLYCESKSNPGHKRYVNEQPHRGDKSKCVMGADGKPKFVRID